MTPTSLDNLVNNLSSISPRRPILLQKINNPIQIMGNLRSDEYEISLVDKFFGLKMPFVLNEKIADVVSGITTDTFDERENAKNIFDWVVSNITYGKRKRGNRGYRNSVEVFNDSEGVCGEMAMLYLTMIRSVGMRGSYAHVDVDSSGSRVKHACAMIDVEGEYGPITFVDPAYKSYDILHKKVRPLTDFEIFKNFNRWN